MTNEKAPNDEKPEMPMYAIYIVIFSRVLYSGLTTLGILYLLLPFLNLPFFPEVGVELSILAQWFGVFAIVAFIVIGAGFKLWLMLSWGTAYVLSSKARVVMDMEYADHKKAKAEKE